MVMKKLSFNQVLVGVPVGLGFAIALNFSTKLQTPAFGGLATERENVEGLVRINFEPPPNQPGQPGESAGGATRGKCLQDKDEAALLTLLIPKNNQTLTIAERPTFFVYVPPTVAQTAQFVLKEKINSEEKEQINIGQSKVIYETDLTLTGTPGIISFKLPINATKLEINKNYEWSFSLICDLEDRGIDAIRAGSIKRIELSPNLKKDLEKATPLERAMLYAKNGIWQDTITILADLQRFEANNSNLKITWQDLLKSDHVNLGKIAEESLVECCQTKNEINSN